MNALHAFLALANPVTPTSAATPAASGFPFLTILVWLPLVGALVILALPERNDEDRGRIKMVAFVFTLVPLLMAAFALFSTMTELGISYSGGFKFEENYSWISAFGARYHVGVDGISLLLVALSTLLFMVAVLSSWGQTKRVKEYFLLLLALDIGVTGVFTAMDLLLFFVFWEIELIPMFLLILIWGGPRRVYAAWKFLLFTIVASASLLLAILILFFKSGQNTFDMQSLAQANLTPVVAGALFWLFFICFAIKLPAWPLHTWLPDAHVEAPTAMSVLLAGILLKMGGYGMIRVCAGIFPAATHRFGLAILFLAVVGIIWGGLAALAQDDMKRMVAYSSVSHMGFVLLGLSAGTALALNGAVYQLVAHGLITGALFLLVGLVYDRTHTRSIRELGGLVQRAPYITTAWVMAALAALGLPGFIGFVAEFEIFIGSYQAHHIGTAVAVFGVVLSAAYMLWMLQRVFFGPIKEAWVKLKDWDMLEFIYMAVMLAFIFFGGMFPGRFAQLIDYAANPISQKITGS